MLWRLFFRFNGKPKTLSFGKYPDISLKAAREMRDEALALLRKGIDPASKKQEDKAASKAGRSDVVTAGGPAIKDVAKEWL